MEARIQQLWQVNVICSALKFRAQKKKLPLIPRSNEYPPRWCSKSASHVQRCFYFFRFIFQPVGLEAPALHSVLGSSLEMDAHPSRMEWFLGWVRSNHTLTNSIFVATHCECDQHFSMIRFRDGLLLETLEEFELNPEIKFWGFFFAKESLKKRILRKLEMLKGCCKRFFSKNKYISII